ncbi:MAG: primosomal protein [Planctomycetota bacterium]|jgi:hypothetical protein
MALLISELTEEIQYITEANEKGEKNLFIEGIIMQGDIKNRNGRVYPSNVLIKEMNRYNDNYVTKNRAFGELGHPQGPTINLDRVSHLFTELKANGSNVVGKAKIIDTPMGNIVKGLIESGAQLGISSRGMGSVKPNKEGIMEVQNDFMLATAGDIVADPSAPDAFVKGIMEGVDWIYDVASSSWIAANTFDRIEEEVKKTKQFDEALALNMFKQFLKSL